MVNPACNVTKITEDKITNESKMAESPVYLDEIFYKISKILLNETNTMFIALEASYHMCIKFNPFKFKLSVSCGINLTALNASN